MVCAQRVVRVVHEGDVQSTPFLAEAHVIIGSAPFLAGLGSAPITLSLSHLRAKADAGRFLWLRNLTNLAVSYGFPVRK